MRIIDDSSYHGVREDLFEFNQLCQRFDYVPTKDDYQEIVNFLLLFQTGTATICESNSALFNGLIDGYPINELGGDSNTTYDPSKDTESATGLAIAGTAAAVGAVGFGAYKLAGYIKYLFKRKKVRKSVQAELKAELNKLSGYGKLVGLRDKLIAAGDEDIAEVKFPGMTKGVPAEEK